jgi:LysR family transcriptional regulator, glycine cleavage system transcriptional activator
MTRPSSSIESLRVLEACAALLSPTLFASLVREGKLVQPFSEILRGSSWHYLLLKPDEGRAAVRDFRA